MSWRAVNNMPCGVFGRKFRKTCAYMILAASDAFDKPTLNTNGTPPPGIWRVPTVYISTAQFNDFLRCHHVHYGDSRGVVYRAPKILTTGLNRPPPSNVIEEADVEAESEDSQVTLIMGEAS